MNAKEFDGALESILNDKVSPPNLEAVGDASEALVLIRRATGKMHKPYQITIGQQLVWYPKIFCCSAGMASRFDGSGVILSDLGVHKFTMCDTTTTRAARAMNAAGTPPSAGSAASMPQLTLATDAAPPERPDRSIKSRMETIR